MRLASLLLASLVAVTAFTADFLFNFLNLQPHRFTFGGRFLDFADARLSPSARITSMFFRDDPTSFDGDVRGALAAYNRQQHLRPLGRLGDDNRPYYTHPGYQVFLLAAFTRLAHASPASAYSYGVLISALLTALTFTALLTAIWREFSPISAILTFVLLMCSDWLVFIGASVYWVSFTIYLPMATAWLAYPTVIRNQVRLSYVALLLSVLVFMRCTLGGYEFITSILLSFTVPVVYYRIKTGSTFSQLARELLVLSMGGSLGFVLAVLAHCLTLAHGLGSLKLAAVAILRQVAPRALSLTTAPSVPTQTSSLPGFLQGVPPDLLKAGAYFSNSIVTLPFLNQIHVYLAVAVAAQVLLPLLLRKHSWNPASAADHKMRALYLCLLWSILCSFTWVLLMPGHMRPHVHFATVVLYVPWLITLYIFVATTIAFRVPSLAGSLCARRSTTTGSGFPYR